MDFLPKQKDEFKRYTCKNERYGRISQKFNSEKRILAQIAFLVDVHAPFNKFLVAFQGDRPLIHVMFTELKKVLVAIMKRFINNDEINGKSAKALLKLDVKNKDIHLPLENIEIGAKTDRLLKGLSPYDKKKEREKMLQFYVATVKQLQRRLPLEDALLFNASYLHPGARIQANSLKMIERLAKLVTHVVSETEVSQIKDEWRLYMVESETKLPPIEMTKRVDHYWNKVFQIKTNSGTSKYTKLSTLIKATLAFQNGNASVEMSLFDNKNAVTAERTLLMEETIAGLRRMKKYARKYGGAHSVPITEDMIKGMKEAKR